MSMSALCRWGCRGIAGVAALLIALVFLPGIPPHVTFTAYEFPAAMPRTGPLAPNSVLDDAERVLEGHLEGPESMASRRDGELFVGCYGGKIMRIGGKDFDQVETVARLGGECEKPWQKTCAFPLGLRFSSEGRLLVIVPVFGLFSVDVDTGETKQVFDVTKEIEGAVPGIPDDLDIDAKGNIYWSDASPVADTSTGDIEMLSDPHGRLIKYDPKTKTQTVLAKNLHFANGIQLSPSEDFVLITETFGNRVMRHWLQGPKSGTTDVFADRLPGMPDNIRAKSNGGYYVSLIWSVHPDGFEYQRFWARLPWLRKLILRVAYLTKMMLDAVSDVFPNDITEMMSFRTLNLRTLGDILFGKEAIVVELDENGNMIGSLQGRTGNMWLVSETQKIGNNLFFGSPFTNFLGRIRVGTQREEHPTKRTEKTTERKMDVKDEL